MACNSKINFLNHLRNENLIDEKRVVTYADLNRINKVRQDYQQYSQKEYNIPYEIFSLDRIKLPNSTSAFRLNPNEEFFQFIDKVLEEREEAKQDVIQEIDYFTDIQFEGNNLEPNYEKYIVYKENLIYRAEESLRKLNNNKKIYASDINKLKRIAKLENEIKDRLEGSEIEKRIGLREEVIMLKNAPPIDKILFYANPDLKRLEALSNSLYFEDLSNARVIINFYKALGTFDVKENHPLFETDQIFNEQGELTLPEHVVDILKNLKDRAKSYENKIEQKEKTAIVDLVNHNTKIKKTFGDKVFTYDELFNVKDGLKDATWIDMFLMDITNGILSNNGIIPQVMMNVIQNSFEENLVYAKSVEERVSNIQKEVEAELRKLGYDINIPGIKGVSYNLFRDSDENGYFKDSIIQRYSSKFIESKNKMFYKLDQELSHAFSLEDKNQRDEAVRNAYSNRDNWYRKNTIVLDINKIPEIINDETFKSNKKYFNLENSDNYVSELKQILGEQGYKEEVAKQIQLLKNYNATLEMYVDTLIAEQGVEDFKQLNEESLYKIENWEKRNNPFLTVKKYNNSEKVTQGKFTVNTTMSYNYSIPRKNNARVAIKNGKFVISDTTDSTGYYNEKFNIIEENPILKEFHTLLMEVNQKMFDSMPADVRKKFNANSMPQLKKTLIEILFDKNEASLWVRISKAARELYDKIRELFGINPQNELSYAKVDPITGKPEYKVNSEFLKGNKQAINKRYYLELIRLKKALGDTTMRLNKFDLFNLNNVPQEVIQILAENLNVESSLSAIKKRLPNTDLTKFELGKHLKSAITHQIVSESSFDLPKAMKLFSYMTQEYVARQKVLPLIEMLKKHYNDMKAPNVTNLGKRIVNESTNSTRLEGERVNAVKQMDSWFQRVVLGNYASVNELEDSRIKRTLKIKLNKKEEEESSKDKFKTIVDGKILNTDEKIIKKKIEELIKDDTVDPETKAKLQKQLDELGKQFSFASAMDAIFNFIRFKGLGWNVSSYVTNFMEGQIANMTIAATGDYFTPENIYKANDIVKGSFLKNSTFGKVVTKGAKKTRVLMDRYRILQDASNELQKASSKSAFSNFSSLSPYEGTRRTEYLNQAPLMIARLMDEKITGKDGQESTVWETLDSDGNLMPEFATTENILNWEQAKGKNYNDFASAMKKMIVNAHGDYDELRGNMASERISGKALLMFKRWLSRQIYQRFAMTPQADIEVEMKEYKGRYFSHTASSGFLHGAIIGFGGLGLLGSGIGGVLIGAGLGASLGQFYGAKTGMDFLKELSFNTKELFLNLARMSVNNITGKDTVKHDSYEKFKELGVDERTMNNMKANLIEMSIILGFIGMLLFAKALLWDDEDEEDSWRRQMHNLFANRFLQLAGQSAAYVNPKIMYDNVMGEPALLRFITDTGKLAEEASDFIIGDDIIPSGPHAGESALWRQLNKTLFPSLIKPGLGFESQMEKQFEKSPFDDWFKSEETISKEQVKTIRAEERKNLADQGIPLEEAEKLLQEKYPSKKKDQTYTELLELYEANGG